MEKKIGFFEKYDKVSGQVEKSSTKLQSFLTLLFFFVFTLLYVRNADTISIEFILLEVILLTAVFAPKHIKDFGDIKEKISAPK